MSGRTAYILSLLHELDERLERPKRKLGDLLSADSRIFLKPEYGPVSNDWPAISFTDEGYARKLGETFTANEDLVLFVGADNRDLTSVEYRKKLLCVSRVRPGPPVDSGVLVAPQRLNHFQQGDLRKFAYSLQVTETWTLTTLPDARNLVGDNYAVIGLGEARRSYLLLSPAEIDRLRDLPHCQDSLVGPSFGSTAY